MDAFVTELNTAGSALVFSSYLGGSRVETGFGIAVDSTGEVYLTEETASSDFPTVNALQPTFGGTSPVSGGSFVAKITFSVSTSTTVVSSLNPSVYGQLVTFTATVSPATSGSNTASGTVTFKDGATTIGSGTLSSGQASFTTSTLAVGGHPITAVYSGDSNFMGSTGSLTQTVNPPSVTSVSVFPPILIGGLYGIGTVTLSSPAPPGGIVVHLGDTSFAADIPATVIVPAGATSANFIIFTHFVLLETDTITVSFNAVSKSVTVLIVL